MHICTYTHRYIQHIHTHTSTHVVIYTRTHTPMLPLHASWEGQLAWQWTPSYDILPWHRPKTWTEICVAKYASYLTWVFALERESWVPQWPMKAKERKWRERVETSEYLTWRVTSEQKPVTIQGLITCPMTESSPRQLDNLVAGWAFPGVRDEGRVRLGWSDGDQKKKCAPGGGVYIFQAVAPKWRKPVLVTQSED